MFFSINQFLIISLLKVKEGKEVQFMMERDGQHVLVDAKITSKRIFQVPKSKSGKFVVGNTDETSNFEKKPLFTESFFEAALNKVELFFLTPKFAYLLFINF